MDIIISELLTWDFGTFFERIKFSNMAQEKY